MDKSIFISLFQNASILLAFSMLYEHLWIRREHLNKLSNKIFTGLIIGAIGILIMFTPWVLKEGLMFDTRSVVLSISGYFFGLIPTLIAAIITIIFRIFESGDGVIMGSLVIITSSAIGLIFKKYKSKIFSNSHNWRFLLMAYIVHIIMALLIFTLPKSSQYATFSNMIIPLLTFYPFVNYVLALLFRNQKINFKNSQASKKLSETEKKLSSILKSGNIFCVIIDKNANIEYCNEFFLKSTKYELDEVKGKNWFTLFIPDKLYINTQQLFDNAKQNSSLKFDNINKLKTKSNTELIVSWYNTVHYNEKNIFNNVISIGVDITEAKSNEKQLLIKNKDLEIAKEKLLQADNLKNEFINNMSHEIRTPMNGIMGFLSLLLDENSDNIENKTKAKYFKIIRNSGNQLMRIIDDLIEISQLSTKQVKAINTKVSLFNLFSELYSVFVINNNKTEIDILLEINENDKSTIMITDKSKLNKILSNLIENAIKYTNQGYVIFGYYSTDKQIVIYVKDSGIGIEKAKQEEIFDRFTRSNIEDGFQYSGLGLGLSIVKENVELLNGVINLESELGKGSEFKIHFDKK